MSYQLDTVVGDFDRLRSWSREEPEAVVAPLAQRMGLLVMTPALRGDLPRVVREVSRSGQVAHVEADFWGGDGHQTASLWRSGECVWGPERTADFALSREGWPINAALARLGVVPAGAGAPEYRDLFVEVGLGRGRDEDDWRRAALRAWDVADYDEWSAQQRAEREREERAAAERDIYQRLTGVPAALDGKEIIALLGIPQGRMVGAAIRHLQQLHLERGPSSREEAEAALRTWAMEQGLLSASEGGAD